MFVGVRHRELLDQLVSQWRGLRRPHLVTLSGFPGLGKSRLIQELYACVAREQEEPAYWPLSLPVHESGGLTARRKVLAPGGFTVPAGSHPTFVWLALEGRRRDGVPEFALGSTAFASQLQDHVVDLIEALERRSRGRRQAAADVGRSLKELVGFVPVLAPLSAAFGAADTLSELKRSIRSVRATLGSREQDRVVGLSDTSAARRAAAAGLAAISESLPIVLAIEDAHDLDSVTVKFLHDLLEAGRGRVLIVATTWPDRLNAHSRDGLESFSGLASQTTWSAVSVLEVPKLKGDDLGAVLLDRAPRTDARLVNALVERCDGNPLMLEGLLSLRAVSRSLDSERQAFTLEPDDARVTDLPADVTGVYQQLWDELPDGVRDVLMVASTEGAVFTTRWAAELASQVLETSDAEVRGAQARDTYGWIRTIDDQVDKFVETALLDRATAATRRELTTAERTRVRTAIVEHTLEERNTEEWHRRPSESRSALLGHVINAASEELIDLQPDDELSCRKELGEEEAASYRFRRAIELLDGHIPEGDDESHLEARYCLSCWLAESGRVEDAIEQYQLLLADEARVLGDDHPNTLAVRANLASALADSGRVEDAIEQLQLLLADLVRVLGDDHPSTLAVRGNLASAVAHSGCVEDAIEQFQLLLADLVRVLGDDHPSTLAVRANLASWLLHSGCVEDAIEQFQLLLADLVRVLGDDHPNTLTVRGNLASAVADSGRVEDAIEQYQLLLADQVRVLGDDHPSTLGARSSLAAWLFRSGRVEDAIEQLPFLLADKARVLGDDHPSTLAVRGGLASGLARSGRVEDAIAQFQLLLADCVRVLGDDHPNTLMVRGGLASALGDSGRVEDAIEQYQLLLADLVRVLGNDHRDTLAVRANLAAWLFRSGRVEDAIEQFQLLLADYVRVLGDDHPNTLIVRGNLASAVADSGRVEDAIEQYQLLLADLVRVLDDDHPATLGARSSLASALGDSGRVEDAIEQLQLLLADSLRLFGPEHGATLKTKADLVGMLFKSGRLEAAAEQIQSVLPFLTRVLGDDDPENVALRDLLRSLEDGAEPDS